MIADSNYHAGFFISFIIFYTLSAVFPPAGLCEVDEIDVYGTFTPEEAAKLGVITNTSLVEASPSAGSRKDSLQTGFDKSGTKGEISEL